MGWFWTRKDPTDPVSGLDPSLKAVLDHQNKPSASSKEIPELTSSATATKSQESKTPTATDNAERTVPTLFPDGRYAHLWGTYKPQVQTTPQEMMEDVLDGYKNRKQSIGTAALENCADLQWKLSQCYREPKTFMQQASLCRAENREFNRCLDINKKFLSALGYMSELQERPIDEDIQRRADELYREMIDEERAKERIPEAKPAWATIIRDERTLEERAVDAALRAREKELEKSAAEGESKLNARVAREISSRLKN